MSHGKHFTLYNHTIGPNGWKVAVVLQELGLTYESIYLVDGQQKAPEFTKYNPNGRIPAIIDHQNNDFVLWESCAILIYLIDKYDTEKKFAVSDEADKYQVLQWLFFQASGQGPYFGQMAWFKFYHHEKIPSAIQRYKAEVLRVFGVLESVLSTREWLVAGKLTVADMSFVTWTNFALEMVMQGEDWDFSKQFPNTSAWHNKMVNRPAIAEVVAIKASVGQKA